MVEGLQQIIHRIHFERLNRVFVVGRHEDDRRHPFRSDPPDDIEARAVRQFHVQQNQVHLAGAQSIDGLRHASALAGNLDVFPGGEAIPNAGADQRLVVNDQ